MTANWYASWTPYRLDEDAPNNTPIRHWGVWDEREDFYADSVKHGFCYGMLYREAHDALDALRAAQAATEDPVIGGPVIVDSDGGPWAGRRGVAFGRPNDIDGFEQAPAGRPGWTAVRFEATGELVGVSSGRLLVPGGRLADAAQIDEHTARTLFELIRGERP